MNQLYQLISLVRKLTDVLAVDNKSYFLSQYDEEKLEIYGAKSMFENLKQDSMLDAKNKVIASFGIGEDSSQFMFFSPDIDAVLLSHNAGMDKINELKDLSKVIDKQLTDDVINKLIRAIIFRMQGEKLVICLKSGSTLLCDSNEEIRKAIIKL